MSTEKALCHEVIRRVQGQTRMSRIMLGVSPFGDFRGLFVVVDISEEKGEADWNLSISGKSHPASV